MYAINNLTIIKSKNHRVGYFVLPKITVPTDYST